MRVESLRPNHTAIQEARMEPSWHALGPEPARVGPAPGQYRKALHTNVCSTMPLPLK